MKAINKVLYDANSKKFYANVNGSLVEINNINDLADVYTKTETDNAIANAVEGLGGGSVESVTINGTNHTPTNGVVDLGTIQGQPGPQGPQGPQGNSGVGNADNFVSVNNLNGGTTDTEQQVFVLGANMGKELNDTFSPLKPLIGNTIEDVEYENGRYSNYNVNVGSTYTGNASAGGNDSRRAKLTVKAGDKITVYGKTDVWGGLYAFCDTDDVLVAKTAASQNVAEADALEYTAPTDGTIYLYASSTEDFGCTWQHKDLVKADATHDGIMTKEQAGLLNTAASETVKDKNLNKMKFGIIGTSSETVFSKYIDIPRSCFGNTLYLWYTSGNYTSNNASWAAAVTNGVVTRHDFASQMKKLYDGNDQYYIVAYPLDAFGDCDYIRMSLYNYDDTRINAMFVGSDLDADYLSWDFVKLRQVPPVSSEWYRGENKEIAAIVSKKPSDVPGVYVSTKNLVNPYSLTFMGETSVSPCYPAFGTDFIPVSPNTLYTKTIGDSRNAFNVRFFDETKTKIGNDSLYDRFTTPSNAAYVKIILTSYNNLSVIEDGIKVQLEQGEKTEYEPYFLFPNELKKSPLSGKTFASIGDSFSSPGTWQQVMCDILGASVAKNVAEDGGRWSDTANPKCAYEQALSLVTFFNTTQSDQSTPPTKPDYILVTLGVNDVGNVGTDAGQVQMGDIVYSDTIGTTGSAASNEIDPITFTGGIQAALKTLKDNFPTSIIKVGYTPAGMMYLEPNKQELVNTYLERLKLVANLYGVGYIETRACGICKIVQSEFNAFSAGGGNSHPGAAGQQRMGEYMARLMLSNL